MCNGGYEKLSWIMLLK